MVRSGWGGGGGQRILWFVIRGLRYVVVDSGCGHWPWPSMCGHWSTVYIISFLVYGSWFVDVWSMVLG